MTNKEIGKVRTVDTIQHWRVLKSHLFIHGLSATKCVLHMFLMVILNSQIAFSEDGIYSGKLEHDYFRIEVPIHLEGVSVLTLADTGSANTVLNPACAEFLCEQLIRGPDVKYEESVPVSLGVFKIGSARKAYPSYLNANVYVGEKKYHLDTLDTWSHSMIDGKEHIRHWGLLGCDVLCSQCLEIDFSNNKFAICSSVPKRYSESASVIPLILEQNRPFIELSISGINERLLVDTGDHSSVIINKRMFNRIVEGTDVRVERHLSVSSTKIGSEIIDLDISLGSSANEFKSKGVCHRGNDTALIGMNALRHFDWCWDFPNKKAYFLKSKFFLAVDTSNAFGMQLEHDEQKRGQVCVRSVASNSIANLAGVEPGDQIVCVEDDLAKCTKSDDMRYRICHADSGEVKITIDRNGDIKDVILKVSDHLISADPRSK